MSDELSEQKPQFSEEGLNLILREAGSDKTKRATLLEEMQKDPRDTAARRLSLTKTEQTQLKRMSDDELAKLTNPIEMALKDSRPFKVKLHREDTTPQAAATDDSPEAGIQAIKCTITIEFEL